MKTYLVTGAAGFIASNVCKKLLSQGAAVIGVDNLNDYYDVTIKNFRLEELRRDNHFQFAHLDIEDKSAVNELFLENNFDAIFNLAARAGVRASMENPDIYLSTNTQGTINLLELANKHKVSKLVLASTSSLYAGQEMPFLESLDVNTPISPYAASKKSAEMFCHAYHYLYGIDISIVRYFTVYGPAGRPDMCIFRFIKWIDEGEPIELFGDGSQSRDFTYVDDIAEGTILATKNVGFEVFNLGGGQDAVSLNAIITRLEELLSKKAIINNEAFHKADIKETRADITKAKSILNWSPKVGFDDGLQNCVNWYINNREWLKNVRL